MTNINFPHRSSGSSSVKKSQGKPIIWSISGSDCSGGAGIAADIKTAHGIGLEICHFITANTVQNSQQLLSINPVDVAVLQQQFDCLCYDKPPSVIKIGLIANSEQLHWLCQIIARLKREQSFIRIIYDPVGQASVGGKLSSLLPSQLKQLLSLIDVITPNLTEAYEISGFSQNATCNIKQHANNNALKETAFELANAILLLGPKAIIIKGGHIATEHNKNGLNKNTALDAEQCTDFCITSTSHYQLSSPRIKTNASHGGGCCFATALSCFIARGYLLRDAFTLTKAFMQQGLAFSAANYQNDTTYQAFEPLGWPKEKCYFPRVITDTIKPTPAFKLLAQITKASSTKKKAQLGLYPVVNSIEWLAKLLPLGLNIIQLRLKNLSPDEREHTIKTAIAMSKRYTTQLFINDYWQLAIKHGAYGVHLGQEDLAVANLAAIHQAGLRLGLSTHGHYEFLLAQQIKPSYLAIGAIFPTKTKDMTGQIQGVDNLKQILSLADDIPVVAIGGIALENAKSVIKTGVNSIAVVTAITESENPIAAVNRFNHLIETS